LETCHRYIDTTRQSTSWLSSFRPQKRSTGDVINGNETELLHQLLSNFALSAYLAADHIRFVFIHDFQSNLEKSRK
jgi:hypothetical protein